MDKKSQSLLRYTKEKAVSYKFKKTYRTAPCYFTRKSTLNFRNTMLMTLRLVKKSTKVELMDCFHDADIKANIPSRQAFSQAREKISYLAFKDLFEKSCELSVNDKNPKLYKGYRIFAIDGTSFIVGKHSELSERFGQNTAVAGKAMCRISGVVDVLDDCIVNAEVSAFCSGERSLAVKQIEELKNVEKALYLFDRGYWSPELVAKFIGKSQKFLMRLASNSGNLKIEAEYGLRRYSFILPCGEPEVLLTNIAEDEMSNDELAALYAKRWGIETKYLELKARLQIDKFSGESVNIVLQDIYSTLYISNLVAFICDDADDMIEKRTAGKDNKYQQKANRSLCISALRRRFVCICLIDSPDSFNTALDRLANDISKDVAYLKKSKSRPRDKRNIKISRSIKFMNPL